MSHTRPRWVQFLQRRRHWFDAAKEILKTIHSAREGGLVSQGLAAITSAGIVVDTLYPGESAWEVFRNMGMVSSDLRVGGFLCEVLMASEVPRAVVHQGLTSIGIVWLKPNGEPLVGAIYGGAKFDYGPFLPIKDSEEELYETVREVVWNKGDELMLSTLRSAESTYRGAGRFILEDIEPLGHLVGKRRPEWYAKRLAKYRPGPRTVLLRGPTGVGKSVLARHASKLRNPGGAQTLKIDSNVLKGCSHGELLGLVRALQPTVLLLDDLDLTCRENGERFLALLETLRDPHCLVFITMMTAPGEREELPKPGDWHFPGIRPGRVENVWTLYLPDPEEREEILRLYATEFDLDLPDDLMEQLVEATDLLSGAYLRRVADELATHGIGDWRDEVNQVLYTADIPKEKGEEDGDGKTPEKNTGYDAGPPVEVVG